ncbi:LOW QUALITY PROTEIN: hypothetical protein IFM46972_01041 [Aspergillus udagawae]|uniref:Uncharacterized protein n=1 Tax=Aspergillus udagawae TaxID=91492 RepID=A0A8H3N4D8_9EURO|nr:LOW QUALITY PROTEIN: hypothetical protein IFM46972_01041 [Aspergillus udagawae]
MSAVSEKGEELHHQQYFFRQRLSKNLDRLTSLLPYPSDERSLPCILTTNRETPEIAKSTRRRNRQAGPLEIVAVQSQRAGKAMHVAQLHGLE